MRNRVLFALAALAALLLPVGAWLLIEQMEALLRDVQERAQIDAAQAMAHALAEEPGFGRDAGSGLYVHPLQGRIVVDGSGDDWAATTPQRSRDGRLRLHAAADERALYLLLEVTDSTRARADADTRQSGNGDAVELILADATATQVWLLGNEAPGGLQGVSVSGSAAPPEGEWMETPSGYRVEMRLPLPAAAARMDLRVRDVAEDGTQQTLTLHGEPEALALLRPDAARNRALAQLTPAGARLRVVNGDGWVIAGAGKLGVPEGESVARVQRGPASWLYRLLLASRDAGDLEGDLPRLDAPVVWQALSGVPASSVRASATDDSVIVTAAVPLAATVGASNGALLLEQGSDALLVLTNRAFFLILAASLLLLFLVGVALLAYAGRQALRIRSLRNAAEQALGVDGRLNPKLPHITARDDLGDLARSFARLLAEIGGYNEYLRTLASKLSHEMHTPLAIVRSSLDNLDHEPLGNEARTYAQRARDGAERLTSILRSMAAASRVERAIDSAEGEDFDLAELVRDYAGAARDLLAPRALAAVVPEGRIGFHGAPDLIAQALDKLIDNARSFTPLNGWLRVSVEALDEGALLRVANAGPALPDKLQERMFDSMVSLRDGPVSRDGDAPHLGLGLFVVRAIAELHRGEASAHNLPDGSGVEFVLRLRGMPRRRAPVAP